MALVIAMATSAASNKELDLPLQVFDVTLNLGCIQANIPNVVATTPALAAEAAAEGWLAIHDDHEQWGIDPKQFLAEAKATWIRRAKSQEDESIFLPETWGLNHDQIKARAKAAIRAAKKQGVSEVALPLPWWGVHFDPMGADFQIPVQAASASDAIRLATQEAMTYEAYFSGTLGLDHDEFLRALDPIASWSTKAKLLPSDAQTWVVTLPERAKTVYRAMGLTLPGEDEVIYMPTVTQEVPVALAPVIAPTVSDPLPLEPVAASVAYLQIGRPAPAVTGTPASGFRRYSGRDNDEDEEASCAAILAMMSANRPRRSRG